MENKTHQQRQSARDLAIFLLGLFLVWTLRATVLYRIDETISSPLGRSAYSCLMKLVLWVLPAAGFIALRKRRAPARFIGLTVWPSGPQWARGLGMIGGFLTLIILFETLAGHKHLSASRLASASWGLSFLQLGVSPMLEELLFRGFVLKEFLSFAPRNVAMGITSLLFVGIHLPFWISHGGVTQAMAANAVGVFLFSMVACWLFATSESIWPPTLAHIANNLLASMLVTSGA